MSAAMRRCAAVVSALALAVIAVSMGAAPAPSAAASAAHDVVVMGLFRDKAVVMVDGVKRLLAAGERSPEGITLIEADSRQAILEINGARRAYRIGTRVTTAFAPRVTQKATIYRGGNGLFTTVGSIDGLPVDFLVDTGASAVALNAAAARRLGIPYRLDGAETRVRTASGTARAYSVKLDRVNVGGIVLRGVGAFVIEGSEPSTPLLGMSYLGRLTIRNEGDVMFLERAY